MSIFKKDYLEADEVQDLFSLPQGKRKKAEGMTASARARNELLEEARDIARHIGRYSPEHLCTSDDVAQTFLQRGLKYADLGNAAGSIFKGKEWEFSGRYTKSRRVSAHARDIKIWRLRCPTL